MGDICSFTSERQRLEFQKTINLYSLPATLGSVPDITETVLRAKGFVLDSLFEDRLIAQGSEDPDLKSLLDQLRVVSRRLMQRELETNGERGDETPSPGQNER